MKRRAGDRFRFKPQLGDRLRELRLKAGLTQQMLAVAMGSQCKGNHTVVSRLENGRMANPGIGFVADYLRAGPASARPHSPTGRAVAQSPTTRSALCSCRSVSLIRPSE